MSHPRPERGAAFPGPTFSEFSVDLSPTHLSDEKKPVDLDAPTLGPILDTLDRYNNAVRREHQLHSRQSPTEEPAASRSFPHPIGVPTHEQSLPKRIYKHKAPIEPTADQSESNPQQEKYSVNWDQFFELKSKPPEAEPIIPHIEEVAIELHVTSTASKTDRMEERCRPPTTAWQ
ncbi:hypothetical protein PROFUN_00226 [Planoprotostelium fungivorum]|uniref:Uncharacterized protein n=1 Tax=Planoprotostelium fungivorum TaxID=1890364 RepID=A0A2P6NXW1_9EUKA|nr:hypothetical protein PROFUN_00226 [Planoprotostelium fungivorum]